MTDITYIPLNKLAISGDNVRKTATAAQGKNMTDVLIEFIQQYVHEHYPKGLKRGRA